MKQRVPFLPAQSSSAPPCRPAVLLACLASCLILSPAAGQQPAIDATSGVEAPHAPGRPHAARSLPDRIILTPGADPAREMGIAWRTDTAQETAVLELAPAAAAPNFGRRARALSGTSVRARTENGEAVHHRLALSGLEPDTAYAYRVKGSQGWSEWHQFRTAAAEPRPFRFLYFGDTQNDILAIGSLAWRRAYLMAGDPALALHAGDLVSSRADMVHDDEWGEWAAAGSWVLASVPQLVAPGNHEYVDAMAADGSETRRLGAQWQLHFALPANGAPGAEATTYAVDYQGVRFIVLDGTSALDLGTLESQTAWLEAQLQR
ncbi:MAG: metallophosphoesterase family protein, partial [Sphingomonadaceae bacterium]